MGDDTVSVLMRSAICAVNLVSFVHCSPLAISENLLGYQPMLDHVAY